MAVKIYCDNGACPDELKQLQKDGVVGLYMFGYENKNRHINNSGKPSAATWADTKNYTWNDVPGTWEAYNGSDKYSEIVATVGLANKRVDILHLDSAYKSKCDAFITNDKDDIWQHREQLQEQLGFRVFHTSEMTAFAEYIASANKRSQPT
jgi:hypothetical protein